MRKTLLATTALAFAGAMAAGPALAADKMSVGVSGYMQQWFGMSSVDATDATGKATAVEGGAAQHSDSEIWFKGKLEADNGLAFSVKVELEGNTHASMIDESQLTVSGAFGAITLGSEDDAATLTHHGNRDVGVSMLCGDVGNWIAGVGGCPTKTGMGFGTAGHGIGGDDHLIAYFSPRVSGVQFGVSYIPKTVEDKNEKPANNDEDAISVGANYVGDFGGASIAVSAGHYQASQTVAGVTAEYAAAKPAKTYTGTKVDEHTFTNFGLQVDFGSFGFDVAYAENDAGHYMANGKKVASADYEVVSAGVNYSDGPMAVSLGHYMGDADDGSESSATMLSLSYTLAPGVASKTSLFAGEQSAGGTNKTSAEGTAFVTGFVIGF